MGAKTTTSPTIQARARARRGVGSPLTGPREAFTAIVTGFASVIGCSQLGRVATGANAELANGGGKIGLKIGPARPAPTS